MDYSKLETPCIGVTAGRVPVDPFLGLIGDVKPGFGESTAPACVVSFGPDFFHAPRLSADLLKIGDITCSPPYLPPRACVQLTSRNEIPTERG